jgi:hypothetical protein
LPYPDKSARPEVGFPKLSWEEEELKTRPMALHELPLLARVDVELALIAQRHPRIAQAIDSFWGHRDCVDFLQDLVLSGYREGEKRMGFKPEVVEALITLVDLHKQAFGK